MPGVRVSISKMLTGAFAPIALIRKSRITGKPRLNATLSGSRNISFAFRLEKVSNLIFSPLIKNQNNYVLLHSIGVNLRPFTACSLSISWKPR